MTKQTDFQRMMTKMLPDITLCCNEPFSRHTSFRIGGPAEVMAFPKDVAELAQVLRTASQCGCTPLILGAGTNILAPDAGLPGLTVCLKDCLSGIELVGDTVIRVMAGVTLTKAAVFAANRGLSGLEFAHGIPGTLGGGIFMNAGAYGGELKDVCIRVVLMDMQGNCISRSGEEMAFGYRQSYVQSHPLVVVSADFALRRMEPEQIKLQMQQLMEKRSASQPLQQPSAGSFFKRPVGAFAGTLIENAGLKGLRVGDAAVSEKHAGFLVNLGAATAEDVKTLMQQVTERVFYESGFRLEPEVRIL